MYSGDSSKRCWHAQWQQTPCLEICSGLAYHQRMLFLPLHRKLNRRNFPVLTVALIALNCLIFLGPQLSDTAHYERAAAHYFDVDLDQIEFPLFSEHLTIHGDEQQQEAWTLITERLDEPAIGDQQSDDLSQRRYALMMIESDPGFQLRVIDRSLVPADDGRYPAWREGRDEYQRLRDQAFTQRFQLSFHEPRPLQWLSSMFLHGGLGHLLGNMLFLLMLGLLVEGALSTRMYLGAYLACGVVAAVASYLVHAGEPGGLLGASGAIAGLMGLYAVLFGRRQVRFFYWVFVYFDYVKKPAIWLLPLWFGWEVVQFFVVEGNVAYEAHAAGIATGAGIGWLLHRSGKVDLDYLDEEQKVDRFRDGLATARQLLADLKIEPAKRELSDLLEDYPDSLELLELQFNACAWKPDSAEFHQAAKQLFSARTQSAAADQLLIDAFTRYRQKSSGKIKLDLVTLSAMARRLARRGERKQADVLIRLLLKNSPTAAPVIDAFDALLAAYQLHGEDSAADALRALRPS